MINLDKMFLIRQFAAQLDQLEKKDMIPLFFVVAKIKGQPSKDMEITGFAMSPILLERTQIPYHPDDLKEICGIIAKAEMLEPEFKLLELKSFGIEKN